MYKNKATDGNKTYKRLWLKHKNGSLLTMGLTLTMRLPPTHHAQPSTLKPDLGYIKHNYDCYYRAYTSTNIYKITKSYNQWNTQYLYLSQITKTERESLINF